MKGKTVKWCPMYRVFPVVGGGFRDNRGDSYEYVIPEQASCIGLRCAVWHETMPSCGYCGLIGVIGLNI